MGDEDILVLLLNLKKQVRLVSLHTVRLLQGFSKGQSGLLFFHRSVMPREETSRIDHLRSVRKMVLSVAVPPAITVGLLPVEGEKSLLELLLEHDE